jgi:hypothetical protein
MACGGIAGRKASQISSIENIFSTYYITAPAHRPAQVFHNSRMPLKTSDDDQPQPPKAQIAFEMGERHFGFAPLTSGTLERLGCLQRSRMPCSQ